MKRPAVFFDRDNTLIVSDGYLGSPAGVVLVEGAADAIARVRQLGYATVVFSNQSGVGRGLFTEEAVHAVNARMDEMLMDHNRAAVVDRHEFCPFHPEAVVEAYRQESELRKPKPGMIHQAAQRLALDLSRSWVVGDAPRDIEAGHAAGCRTILYRDPKLLSSPAARAESDVPPDYVVDSLAAAVGIIEVQTRSTHEPDQDDASASIPADSARATSTPLPADAAYPGADAEGPPRPLSDAQPIESASLPLVPAPAPGPPAAPAASDHSPGIDLTPVIEKLEFESRQILQEIRRAREQPHTEFSVSKLLAGIVQIIALAALFLGWIRNSSASDLLIAVLLAIFLQTLTIALLIMGRQK